MSRDSIVLFTDTYPYGWSEEFLAPELERLAGEFPAVTLLPLRYGGSRRARPVPGNVTVAEPLLVRDGSLYLLFRGLFNPSPLLPMVREFFSMRVYRRGVHMRKWLEASCVARHVIAHGTVREILRAGGEGGILYFYWSSGAAWAAPFLPTTLPVVSRFHGFDLYEERSEFAGYIPFRPALLRRLDCALFVSGHGLRYLKDRYPGIAFEARLARLGVEDAGLTGTCGDGVFRVLTCARMVKLKRLDMVAEALMHLDYPVEWTHFGDGPERRRIESLAAVLPENVTCRLEGRVPNDEMRRRISGGCFDLFVNASETEGSPVAVMEALAAGIPVLATAVGGTSELVDDRVGGLLPPSFTPGELAARITALRNDPGRRADCAEAARERWGDLASAGKNFSLSAAIVRDVGRGA